MTAAPASTARPKGDAWHSQSAEDVLAQLVSTADGLSSQEAGNGSRPTGRTN